MSFTVKLGNPKTGEWTALELAAELERLDSLIKTFSEDDVEVRLISIAKNSPVVVGLETAAKTPKSRPRKSEVRRLASVTSSIREGRQGSRNAREVEALYEYAKTSVRKHLSIEFIWDDENTPIDQTLLESIQKESGHEYYEYGNWRGVVAEINIRNKPYFIIDYTYGRTKLRCDFPEEKLDEVKSALGSEVEVAGRIRYRDHIRYPLSVYVDALVLLEPAPKAAWDNLVSIFDAMGDE